MPYPRQYILSMGRLYAVTAAIGAIIGAIGPFVIFWWTSAHVLGLTISWLCFFFPVAGLLGVAAREYLNWARNGPDLWLRITPASIELVQAVLHIKQCHLAWWELQNWSILIFSAKRRAFQLKTISGDILYINPMEYVWTPGEIEKTVARAIPLSTDIEALLKLYAGDRQGPTKTAWAGW